MLATVLLSLVCLSVVVGVVGTSFNYHNYDSLWMDVLSPSDQSGPLIYTPGVYGASIVNPPGADGVEMEVVLAWPDPSACTDLRAGQPGGIARTRDGRTYSGKIMLIERGECSFSDKSIAAEQAGAAIALIHACSPAPPTLCRPDRDQMMSASLETNITSLMIDFFDGHRLAATITKCDSERIKENEQWRNLSSSDSAHQWSDHLAGPTNCSVRVFLNGTSAISVSDRAALTQMSIDIDFTYMTHQSTQSGPLPPFSTIRNATIDPCLTRVAGIWCQGNPGRIVRLDLDSFNLTGTLSPAIGNLTALQQLIVSNNRFRCTSLHCSFNQLAELRVLILFHMALQSFEPASNSSCLGGMRNLVAIDASYNDMTALTPSMFLWTKVRAFDVSNNAITTELGPDLFSVLPDLEYISLSNNQIRVDLDGVNFAALNHIQHLDLSSNRITGELQWHAMDNLTTLLELDVSNKYAHTTHSAHTATQCTHCATPATHKL